MGKGMMSPLPATGTGILLGLATLGAVVGAPMSEASANPIADQDYALRRTKAEHASVSKEVQAYWSNVTVPFHEKAGLQLASDPNLYCLDTGVGGPFKDITDAELCDIVASEADAALAVIDAQSERDAALLVAQDRHREKIDSSFWYLVASSSSAVAFILYGVGTGILNRRRNGSADPQVPSVAGAAV